MSLLEKNRLPSFLTIQLVGWTVYFIVIYITFLTVAQPENYYNLFLLKGFRALTGLVLTSLALRPLYRAVAGRLSIGSLVALVLACATLFGCVWTAIEGGYFYATGANFNLAGYLSRSPRIALDYAMTLTAWSSLYLVTKSWLSWQDERENALRSTALANQAQLEMLRYQINPHFLFNALNSIRASIEEDTDRAKRMITQLSEFLRYSLLGRNDKWISLRDELDAIRNYLAIEKTRFEEKLEVEYDVDERAEDFELPCFLMNPLVENAIKHGVKNSTTPLAIKISARLAGDDLVLEVRNSGTLTSSGTTGVGLANVSERLEKMFGSKGRFALEQSGGDVVARIEISK